jgi:transposase InsO family protein
VRTTDSRPDQPIAPNHLTVASTPTKPDPIWATDITYIETGEGWLYLAGVLDLYSRRRIGWLMGPSMETSLPLAALNRALRQLRPVGQMLHHSDHGCH